MDPHALSEAGAPKVQQAVLLPVLVDHIAAIFLCSLGNKGPGPTAFHTFISSGRHLSLSTKLNIELEKHSESKASNPLSFFRRKIDILTPYHFLGEKSSY